MENFKKLGIDEDVLKVLSEKNFEKPSEIQEKSIPIALEGHDIIAGSETGSGKTLAFGSPIIKNTTKSGKTNALILTPTRELAEQVAKSLEEFSKYKNLEVVPIYGGVSMTNQVKKLTYADIIVATPGRLLDHLRNNSVNLEEIKYLVLDEADRMWDMGFQEDVGKIVESIPKKRQTFLFSATISKELEDFSKKYMNSPVEIQVSSQVDPSKLRQVYYDVKDFEKFSLLVHLLKNEEAHLVMIFCNTRRNVDFVVKNLKEQGINAQAIHGGMSQEKRNTTLKKFDSSKVNVLVATDVAARGLDIKGVSHVYNYDLPSDSRDYVHRIGRTARAGSEGIAINILASRDYDNFGLIQRNFPELKVKNVLTPKFEKVFVKMESREEGGNFRRRDNRRGGSNRREGNSRGRDNRRDSRGRSDSRRPFSRNSDSRGENKREDRPRRSRPDSRGRVQRGDRNKRSSGPRDGFRGSGRNTRRNFSRR